MGMVDRGLRRRCRRLRELRHRVVEEQSGLVDEEVCASVIRFQFLEHPVRKAYQLLSEVMYLDLL